MRRIVPATTLAIAAVASVWIFLAVDSTSHSVSDTLYGVLVPIGLVWLTALAVITLVRRTIRSP